jgi:hypothetical protein
VQLVVFFASSEHVVCTDRPVTEKAITAVVLVVGSSGALVIWIDGAAGLGLAAAAFEIDAVVTRRSEANTASRAAYLRRGSELC